MGKKLSILKRIKTTKRNNLRNKKHKTAVKNSIKRCLLKFAECSNVHSQDIQEILASAYSIIDKAVQKKVLHINSGARKKSRLACAIKKRQDELSLV